MNTLRVLGILLFSFVLFAIYPSRVFAQSVPTIGANLNAYVPPTGAGCNINVPSQYSTIQAAINASTAGNTICVGPGTYNENITINKSIRLSGSGASKSVINGQFIDGIARSTVVVAGDGAADNVILEGFLIHGANGGTDPNANSVNIGPFASGAMVRYNWIVGGNGKVVMRADSGQNNDVIQNNVLEGNNSPSVVSVEAVQAIPNKVDFLNHTFTGTVNYTSGDTGRVLSTFAINSLIKQNTFNTSGVINIITGGFASNVINENNLNSIATVKVGIFSGGTLNAENNWWGDLDPSDNIQGDVDFTPFALSPFPEYPLPVLNQPPVTNAGPDQTVIVGQQVSFDGSNSTDPDGVSDIVSYSWDFGDGNSGSGITTSHAYLSSGAYIATLTITDSAGASSSDSLIVTVQTPAEAIISLMETVDTYNFPQGIENNLKAKLAAAVDSLNHINNKSALNLLDAFISAVNAQRGKKITDEQANILIQKAQEIIANI